MFHGVEDELHKDDPETFKKLLEDAKNQLYPKCKKYTKMLGLVHLYNVKAKHGFSDKGFTELLNLLVDMFPEGIELPSSMYEVKKSLSQFGMEYHKIHACPNDCIL